MLSSLGLFFVHVNVLCARRGQPGKEITIGKLGHNLSKQGERWLAYPKPFQLQ